MKYGEPSLSCWSIITPALDSLATLATSRDPEVFGLESGQTGHCSDGVTKVAVKVCVKATAGCFKKSQQHPRKTDKEIFTAQPPVTILRFPGLVPFMYAIPDQCLI
ncbi:hypothetical protein BaRGS_00007465 [Batillaria attramentaria]|uniref:Uncharacterized protein n=1 Tax=Batillaria attramentaria TaxID=370345 RepID=A0ABD0LPG5_9CAEN